MRNQVFFSCLIGKSILLNSDPIIEGKTMRISQKNDLNTKNYRLALNQKIETLIIEEGDITTVTPYFNFVPNIQIKSTKVTRINDFSENYIIKTIELPNNAVQIGSFKLSSIEKINIDKIESLPSETFRECINIKSITLGATQVPSYFAYKCYNLEKVIFLKEAVSIASNAFSYCDMLKSIDFTHVTSIGENAFIFSGIEEIKIHKKLTSIGNGAFDSSVLKTLSFEERDDQISIGEKCFKSTKLETVSIIANAVLSSKIFQKCGKLKSIIVQSITEIPDNFAEKCINLESVECKDATKLGNRAFSRCISLKSFDAPKLETVGKECFSWCFSLNINLESIKTLKDKAFYRCTSLSFSSMPSAMILSGNSIFYSTSVKSVSISTDIINAPYIFASCELLESVTFGPKCTTIPEYCFSGCIKLSKITIPETVTKIMNYAFSASLKGGYLDISNHGASYYAVYDCLAKTIKLDSNQVFQQGSGIFPEKVIIAKNAKTMSMRIFHKEDTPPNVEIEVEKGNENLEVKDGLIIQEGKYIIGVDRTFNKETLVIPDYIKFVQEYSFYFATTLKKIELRHKINLTCRINEYSYDTPYSSFRGSTSVKSIIISYDGASSENDELVQDCLGYCPNLEHIEIDAPIVKIGSQYLPKLKTFKFGKSIKILDSCFSGATFKTFDATGYKLIGSVFSSNENLAKVNLGDNTIIGYSMFNGCTELREIDTSKVTEIHNYAFDGCHSLEKIDLSSVKDFIYDNAFSNCINLKTIIWPKNSFKIGTKTFFNISFNELTLPDTLHGIFNNAFSMCRFKKLTISKYIINITKNSFYNCSIETLVLSKAFSKFDPNLIFIRNIEIPSDNPYYFVDDHALINKFTGELVCIFGDLPDTYKLPDSVKFITSYIRIIHHDYKYKKSAGKVIITNPSLVGGGFTKYSTDWDNAEIYPYTICFNNDMPLILQRDPSYSFNVYTNEENDMYFTHSGWNEVDQFRSIHECNETLPEEYYKYSDGSSQNEKEPSKGSLSGLEIALIVITVLLCLALVSVIAAYVYFLLK